MIFELNEHKIRFVIIAETFCLGLTYTKIFLSFLMSFWFITSELSFKVKPSPIVAQEKSSSSKKLASGD